MWCVCETQVIIIIINYLIITYLLHFFFVGVGVYLFVCLSNFSELNFFFGFLYQVASLLLLLSFLF